MNPLERIGNKDPKTGKDILWDWSQHARTHCPAVDLVAQIVGFNRQNLIPLKCIYLKKEKYNQFLTWTMRQMIKRMGKPRAEELLYDTFKFGRALQFDDIDIRELNAQAEEKMKYLVGKQFSTDGSYMERIGDSGWIEVYPQKRTHFN
jgi:hypothetical protein